MDWRRFVRTSLPHLDVAPERENEIVEELALQLSATYERALANGATESDACASAAAEVPDWGYWPRRWSESNRGTRRRPWLAPAQGES